MDPATRQRYDAGRNFRSKAFRAGCYAPFVSLYFNTLGHVVACCRNQAHLLGDIGKERLDDIWNGPNVRAMREALADYRFENGCEFCEWAIDAGDVGGAVTHVFEGFPIQDRNPEFPQLMEFAISNTCNFECVQCCGDWSSTIRAHREGLPPLRPAYDDRFFDDLRRYLPHLKQAKFYGGEPFLARENYRIWDMMIEDGLTPRCHVLTNGSQWNDRVERVLEHLDCTIGVSLDAITSQEALEAIRKRADFNVITENIERFRTYTRERGLPMRISFCWMRQNWRELGPMLSFAEERGMGVTVIRVVDPPQFSLFSQEPDELAEIADQLEAQGREVLPRLDTLRQTWLDAVESVRAHASERQAAAYRDMRSSNRELRQDALSRARGLMAEGRWRDAARTALETPGRHKDRFWALLAAAHATRRAGDLDGAEQILEEAMPMTRRRTEPFVERAWLRHDQGRFADGLQDALAALEIAGDGPSPALGNVLHVAGLCHARLGDAVSAARMADRWLGFAGDDAWANLECARMFECCGIVDRAVAAFERAAELASDGRPDVATDALLASATLLRAAGSHALAQQRLQQAIELHEQRADLHLELAWVQLESEQIDAGIRSAHRARELAAESGDTDPRIAHVLGLLYQELGDHPAAVTELERYVSRSPQDDTARERLQTSRRMSGR